MSPTLSLGRLLARWEEALEGGRELSAEELASGRTELLEELREGIAVLKRARRHERPTLPLDATSVPAAPPGEAPTVPPRACPGGDVLARRLAESLGEAERSLVDAHVEGCSGCQAELQRLVSGPDGEKTTAPGEGFLRALKQGPPVIDAQALPGLAREKLADAPEGYEVLGELGRGGMGVVYKARQKGLNRLVALKMVLSGTHAGAEERARFLLEAEAVARVKHPGIVQVYDFGTHGDLPFFSLELCEGGSLGDRLRGGPLAPREAAEVVERVARAVQAAHEAGIVHRDLKPQNVLLTDKGEPRVTDFGLAKKADGSGQTQTGAVMGTPSYMAPEQAEGKKDVGPPADVWALGAILYACLTGRPPFQAATTLDTILQVVADDPVPLRRLNPNVPADLETIAHKCLSKEPGQRYGSAGGMADDLGRWLRGEPIAARPVGELEKLWSWCKREPVTASLVGAVALLLLVGAGVAWGLAVWALGEKGRADTEASLKEGEAVAARKAEAEAKSREKAVAVAKKQAEAEKKRAEVRAKAESEANARAQREKQRAEGERDRAERLVYKGKLSLASSAFADGDGALALQHLDECHWGLRGWEHGHLRNRISSVQTLLEHSGHITGAVFSPDGRRILTCSQDETAKVWDAETGRVLLTLRGHKGGALAAGYSPDGGRIFTFGGDRTVKVWGALTGKELFSLKGAAGSAVYGPDGKIILTGSGDNTARAWDARTGRPMFTLKGLPGPFSPDGRYVLTLGLADTSATLWDARTGKEVRALKGALGPLAFSPDGTRLVSAGLDGGLRVWGTIKGDLLRTIECPPGQARSLTFSPDGRHVAAIHARGFQGPGLLLIWDAQTGKEVLNLRVPEAAFANLTYSPDGGSLLVCLDGARLLDAATGKQALACAGRRGPDQFGAFSPDGRRLVTGGADFAVRVWDTTKGQGPLTLPARLGTVCSVCVSPDGRHVASAAERPFMGKLDTVEVTAIEAGRRVLTLKGAFAPVAYSPDGKRLLTGGEDNTVKMWDASLGRALLTFNGHENPVDCAAFSPDGGRIITGSQDGSVRVWDARTGKALIAFEGHQGPVSCVACSPDGKRVVIGGKGFFTRDGEASVWDAETGKRVLKLKGHKAHVTCVCFSPDGKHILAGGRNPDQLGGVADTTVTVWDAEKAKAVSSLRGHLQGVTGVAYSPDGKRVFTASQDGTVRVWETERYQELIALKGHAGGAHCISLSSDGARVVSGGVDGTVRVWDGRGGQEARLLAGHDGFVTGVAYSPDGRLILTGSEDGKARAWDSRAGRELFALEGHQEAVRVAVSPDGRRILTGSHDHTAKVWDALTGKLVLALRAFPDIGEEGLAGRRINGVAFSPDGGRIACAWGELEPGRPGGATVWDTRRRQAPLSLKGHSGAVYGVCFSPDGERVLTGSHDKAVKAWSARTGKELFTLKGHAGAVNAVAWSSDGKRIVTAGEDNTARVWDARTARELLTLKGHEKGVLGVGLSPDGRRIVTGSWDSTARVWDGGTGQELFCLRGHTDAVNGVAFSPDGAQVLTCGNDWTARVWEADRGQKAFVLTGHQRWVSRVAYSPDGTRVFAWDLGNKALAWDSRTGKPAPPAGPPARPPSHSAHSPDGRFCARPTGRDVTVIDLLRPAPVDEQWPLPDVAERKHYHAVRASDAEKKGLHFAAAFHLGRLLLDDPDNPELKKRRAAALEKLQAAAKTK